MMKLSQLVNSALEDAKTKIASAQDVETAKGAEFISATEGIRRGRANNAARANDAAAVKPPAKVAEKTAGAATALGEKIMAKVPEMGNVGQKAVGALRSAGAHLGAKSTEQAVGRGLMAAGGTVALGAGGAAALAGRHHSRDKASSAEVVSTATEAVKFAESLEHLAMLFPKLASGSVQINDRAGPEVLVSPNKGGLKDTSTKATTLSAAEASHQGGSGDNMHVETFKSPYAKKAAEEILSAKIAQSEALLAAGQARAATALAKQAQAEFEQAKRAYDEDASTPKGSPQSLAVNRKAGDFPVPGNVPGDNAGMISMTKRQAKTEDVRREAGKHVAEPALSAASDRGLTDNLEHTEGAKIANIFAKVAARKQADVMKDEAQYAPTLASSLAQGVVPVPGVGLLGGAYVGHRRGEAAGGKGVEGALRGAGGQMLGGVGGGFAGGLGGGLLGALPGAALGYLGGGAEGAIHGAGIGGTLGGGLGSIAGGIMGQAHGANMATRTLLAEAQKKQMAEQAGQG